MTRPFAVWTCWWVARRVTRYLDADASAPLGPAEVRRLEAHLRVCSYCHGKTGDYREMLRALHALGERVAPDGASIERARAEARRAIARESGGQGA